MITFTGKSTFPFLQQQQQQSQQHLLFRGYHFLKQTDRYREGKERERERERERVVSIRRLWPRSKVIQRRRWRSSPPSTHRHSQLRPHPQNIIINSSNSSINVTKVKCPSSSSSSSFSVLAADSLSVATVSGQFGLMSTTTTTTTLSLSLSLSSVLSIKTHINRFFVCSTCYS